MYYIIGGDGQEYGPIQSEQLKEWILDGRVDENTKVRVGEGSEWQKVGDLADFKESLTIPQVEEEPHKLDIFSKCTSGVGDKESFNEDYRINVGDLLKRGCVILFGTTSGFWLSVCAVLLPFVINFALGMIQQIVSIPLESMLALDWSNGVLAALDSLRNLLQASEKLAIISLLAGVYIVLELIYIAINSIMAGGVYKFFILLTRGNTPDLASCFSGFGKKWFSLAIVPFLVFFIVLLAAIPFGLIVAALAFFGKGLLASGGMLFWILASAVISISLIPLLYVSTCTHFMILVIIDRELNCFEALKLTFKAVSKRWIIVLAANIVFVLAALLGLFGFLVGVIFTLPIAYVGIALIYDEIFGKKA